MTLPTSAAPTSWTAWHRPGPGTRWRAIVSAASEDAAFQQLLDAVAGGDKTVLPAGVDPNISPRTIRRTGPPGSKQLQQILDGQTSGRRIITAGTWTGWLWLTSTGVWQRVCRGDSLENCS